MKKFIKNNLLGFILGGIIFGSIGVGASALYNASEIGFTPNNTEWKANNLSDAINDLYTNTPKISNNLVSEQIKSNETSGTKKVTIENANDYKWYFMNNVSWHCSSANKNDRISALQINSITNATFVKIGETKSVYSTSQSGGSIGYIIYPDGSGEDITITFTNADGVAVYGIK